MGNDLAVELFHTVRRLRREHFAADDDHDRQNAELLGQMWEAAQDNERVTPPSSDRGARVKLASAAYYAHVSAGALGGVEDDLAPTLVRITRATAARRNKIALKDLVALRAILPRASVDPHVSAPLRFAVDWWSRPRTVE